MSDPERTRRPSCDGQENYLLCKNLASLSLFCLWPFQSKEFLGNKSKRRIHYTFGLVVYFAFVIFLVTEYVELVHVWGNLEDMTTNMSVSCLYTVGVLKIFTFFGCRKKLHDLISGISAIEKNILKYQSEEIKMIFYSYVQRARTSTYHFWLLTAATILVFFVIPPIEYRYSSQYHKIFNNGTEYWSYKRPMIFSSWFPFDKYDFPNYLVAYFYHVTMGTIGASYQAIWDTFIVSMIIHAIGQLQILQKMIELMVDGPEKLDGYILTRTNYKRNKRSFKNMIKLKKLSEKKDREVHERMVHCVNHHMYIIRYIKNLNDITSPLMMVYFMVCSLMLCAIGFQASLYGFSIRLCFMVEYLIAMMVQLFLFYWHGNEVVYESNKLTMASYNCNWYNESQKFKKSLWIMRKGLELPIRLTVGPFYTMSLPTFLMILRASYSYFALLRQVQEAQPDDK